MQTRIIYMKPKARGVQKIKRDMKHNVLKLYISDGLHTPNDIALKLSVCVDHVSLSNG